MDTNVAIERYKELYQKALDKSLLGLAFEIAVTLADVERNQEKTKNE